MMGRPPLHFRSRYLCMQNDSTSQQRQELALWIHLLAHWVPDINFADIDLRRAIIALHCVVKHIAMKRCRIRHFDRDRGGASLHLMD